MNATINWQTMPDRDKIHPLIKDIMGWPCYETWETFHKQAPKDIYPVAFWENQPYGHSCWSVFYEPERNAKVFDPLHRIDNAWLIIEKLGIPTTLSYTPGFAQQEPDGQSAHYECKLIELDILGGNDKIARAIANTPAEAICVAALRWMGIQVTHTIEAMPCWEVTFEDGETLICKNKHDAEQIIVQREQYLKDNLQWAVNIRKLKIAEVMVPEDYFNGPVIG